MTCFKSIAIVMLAALFGLSGGLNAEEQIDFCSFEIPYPDQNLVISGGSKSWSLKMHTVFRITSGVKADFREIDPAWGSEMFSHIGHVEMFFSNNGDVVFRSDYLVTQDTPRVSVEKLIESQEKTLLLALAAGDDAQQATGLARLSSQTAGNTIYQFALIKAPQAKPLVDRLDAGLPFTLLIGAGTMLVATSDTMTLENISELKAEGEAQFARAQADAEAGVCK